MGSLGGFGFVNEKRLSFPFMCGIYLISWGCRREPVVVGVIRARVCWGLWYS